MSKVTYNQTGYHGSSMSIRARRAYESGEKPISKFRKSDVLLLEEVINDLLPYKIKLKMTVKELKSLLEWWGYSSWHHTGKFANITYFYSIESCLTFKSYDNLEEEDWGESTEDYDLDFLERIMNYAITI